MKYVKFEIKNFKGINELELDLEKMPNGKIFPLVGLNESGKTTILEAINLFQNGVEEGKEHKMIHKRKIGNFTGNIEIKVTLQLDEKDNEFIKKFLDEKGLKLKKNIDNISITKIYKFNNSKYGGFESEWDIALNVKQAKARKFVDMYDEYNNEWNELISQMDENLVPKILYFENFLFDFPNKIYLNEVPNNAYTKSEIQRGYRKILQDILNSIDESYDLKEHILNRLGSPTEQDEESVKQIINEMEHKLNEVIVHSWKEIFNDSSDKKIEIVKDKDPIAHYLQFKIKEGTSSFYIDERSLGFRWFFGFLLFTEFRKSRQDEKGEYLFLFDEPANTLHQKSQQKLLECFERLTDKSKIIYSTHSHYLLNPKFLLNTFVVMDKGRQNHENAWDDYSQDIKAIPYKQFVSDYPNEETHFKPILDCLEYVENPFEPTSNIVFTEGKFDYYTFKWIKEQIFKDENYNFNFYPGAGVDKYENIFREYLANNRKFVAIFDSDDAGKNAKKRYLEEISQELENYIYTLDEIDRKFNNIQTEGLFNDTEKLNIQRKSFQTDEYKKSEFNTAIQELFIKEESFKLSENTINNFKKIFEFIKEKLEKLN